MLRLDFRCRSRRSDSACPSQCENLIAADVSRNLAVPGVQISQLMASLKCREGSADRVASGLGGSWFQCAFRGVARRKKSVLNCRSKVGWRPLYERCLLGQLCFVR